MDQQQYQVTERQPIAGTSRGHYILEIAEISPVREYADFAEDVRQRWGARAQT